MTREEWLEEQAEVIANAIREKNFVVPPYRVSCGFPSKKAVSENWVGSEIWWPEQTKDGVAQIFISPLVHEGTTAALELSVSLSQLTLDLRKKTAKNKSSIMDMASNLDVELPLNKPYPQGELILPETRRTQSTRLLKISCTGLNEPHDEYILRGTEKALKLGVPYCPICQVPMFVHRKDGEDATED